MFLSKFNIWYRFDPNTLNSYYKATLLSNKQMLMMKIVLYL